MKCTQQGSVMMLHFQVEVNSISPLVNGFSAPNACLGHIAQHFS